MKISINWLKDYLKTDHSPEEISEILTNLGLEVEKISSFESIKGGLAGVVAGKVLECGKHPNADRLKVTSIDIGNNKVCEIVCGAPNIDKGQIVPVATVGSKIYTNQGEEIKIKKSKIRGVISNGMVCAEDEIGLGDSHEGIMVLEKNIKPGTPVSQIFNIQSDKILEIGLTPNRCDAMSHYGVARDLKAFLDHKAIKSNLSLPSINSFSPVNIDKEININVEDSDKCPFYSGLVIKNINVDSSSQEIQNKLKSIGLKPINSIVDITNYVMHEIGQPLHAFDLNKIENITVKSLKSGTKFKTLDKNEIKLNNEDLMICSNSEPLCLAGIYGGINSGVSESTNSLFLESAIFNSVTIRKSSKRHQLFTDASYRYERGVDPDKVIYALKRAALLIKEINPECHISEIFVEDNLKKEVKDIYLRYDRIEKVSGQIIDKEVVIQILTSLDFEIKGHSDDGINLIAPDYRHDVYREIDVIEEILRVFGFDNIDIDDKISMSIPNNSDNKNFKIESILSNQLVGIGFNEIINNSICSPSTNEKFNEDSVELLNPQGIELSNLRQSLIPNLLETVNHNINRQNNDLKLFEIGNVYSVVNNDFNEMKRILISVVGSVFKENWMIKYQENNFFYLKGVIEKLLAIINVENIKYEVTDDEIYDYKLNILKGKLIIGSIGEIKSNYANNFSIDQKINICSLYLDLLKPSSEKVIYQEISKFPSSRRDLSMILDENVSFQDIKNLAYKEENKILKEINLFDEYKDKKIGKSKKSFAISFTFNDSKKTLTDQVIDKIMIRLSEKIKSEFGAVIRDK
ncbi:phenylalanine--tRNA ligase subunit beta [Flavobacteriaceae bacterium]|nr:phenylalanine--tRNA ligase subunit beta [Flavobacteriaceae bacterium]